MAKGAPTQQFLEIDQIKEGVLILKDKSLRGVLAVASLNFALKSEEEQNAILFGFRNFLNSLDFFCQILVRNSRLNITGYLDKLKELEEKQDNELLRTQTSGYREFIGSMIKEGVIMTKTFYVIIPFYSEFLKTSGTSTKKSADPKKMVLTEELFQRNKSQLLQRMEFVAVGLKRCGLQVMPLITKELIELFWMFHHPSEAEFGYYPEIPPELSQ